MIGSDIPEAAPRKGWKHWLIFFIKVAVPLALLVFAWFKGGDLFDKLKNDWAKAKLNFQDFGYGYFFFGTLVFFISMVSTFLRWNILLRAMGIPIPMKDTLKLGFFGFVISQFGPGSISGDVLKAGFACKQQPTKRTAAVASILVDRFIGLYALFVLAAIVTAYQLYAGNIDGIMKDSRLYLAVMSIFAIALGGAVVLAGFCLIPIRGTGMRAKLEKIPVVGRFAGKALAAFGQYRHKPQAILEAIGIGILGHIGFVMGYYYASLSLPGPGDSPSWGIHFVIIPFFMVVQSLPLTFGQNIGVGDAILGLFYQLVNAELLKGILASLVQRVMTWLCVIPSLFWCYSLLFRKKNQVPQVPVNEPAPA